jgi:hypothetical protein
LSTGVLTRPRALVPAEEEYPIWHDRAAHHAPELIAVEAVVEPIAVGVLGRERVGRVEAVVAEELEPVTIRFGRRRPRFSNPAS